MKDDRLPESMVLSEARLRDVINRATRMMPASEGVTIADLRQIALELDIDQRALEQALDQVIGLPIPGHPIRTWVKRTLTAFGRNVDRYLPEKGRVAAGGAFGAVAGWLNAFLPDSFALQTHYPIAAAMVGITIANLLSRRVDKNLAKFLVETIALWGTYGLMWSVTHGSVTGNLVGWVALWSGTASLAGLILMSRSRDDGDASRTEREQVAVENNTVREAKKTLDIEMRVRWALARSSTA